MDVSPFPYQGPLEPDQVRGRDELIADLTERLTERRVTALLGPRRYGKTSVLRKITADLTHAGTLVLWIDFYEVASMADVAARIDDGLSRITGTVGQQLARVAAAMSINLGVVSFELRAPKRDRPDPALTAQALMTVLTRHAVNHPTIVVFDEFSSIARVDGAAGLLRTQLQHHYQQLGLMFAGSEPSMMRLLFTDQAQPFYAQADLLEIGPLSVAEVIDTVVDGFEHTGRHAGPLPSHIASFAAGHPQRTMQLADTAWRRVEAGGTATDDTWVDALDALRSATADGNERLYSSLQEKEKAVLRILAAGASVFGTAADVLDVSTGAAQHARRRLVERGHLTEHDGAYTLVDPVLADWIRHRFPL